MSARFEWASFLQFFGFELLGISERLELRDKKVKGFAGNRRPPEPLLSISQRIFGYCSPVTFSEVNTRLCSALSLRIPHPQFTARL